MNESDLMRELLDEFDPPKIEDGEFTISMMLEHTKKTRRALTEFMDKKTKLGLYKRRWITNENGHREYAFRKIAP